MKASALLILVPLAMAGDALAQTAGQLDLSLPAKPLYSGDPPGTWYGDTSGKPAPRRAATVPATGEDDADAEACEGKVHGSVSAGVGYSRRGGNSNWQGVNLHSCKTYYNDEGKPREVGVSISVGQSSGPGFRSFGPVPGGF